MGRPVKRSFSIDGHRTSISLETEFWQALKAAAAEERATLASLIKLIDRDRGDSGLSSAVRVWLLQREQHRGAMAPEPELRNVG